MALDRRDIERLYSDQGHLVLARARRLLGDEGEAREILQEVFMSLLDRPEQFAGHAAPTTFLYAMTTNLCLNRIRNQRARQRVIADKLAPIAPRHAPGDAEARAIVRQVLVRLPLDEARAALYYYLDGMSRQEVAETLGCSLRQVGYLLERLAMRLDGSAEATA